MASEKEAEGEIALMPKKPGTWLLVIVGVAAAAGIYLMAKPGGKGKPGSEKTQEGAGGEGKEGGEKLVGGKPIMALDGFVVNLNETEANRYLKVTLELGLSSSDVARQITGNMTPVRDAIITYLSSLTLSQTQGTAAKDEMKEQLAKKVNEFLKDGEVKKVYFLEFMVQ